MRKWIFSILLAAFLLFPQTGIADEKSDAEAAIGEAQAMVDSLNALYFCPGPALVMKTEAVNQLNLANEAFGAEKYGEAKQAALMVLEYAGKALGQRAFCYMYKHRNRPPPPIRQPK